MACLIPIQPSNGTEMWANIDLISNIYLSQQGANWDVDTSGITKETDDLLEEVYPTQAQADARIKFIERMVNSKCGTNLKITLNGHPKRTG